MSYLGNVTVGGPAEFEPCHLTAGEVSHASLLN
jgi:hypothetical protein